MSMPGKPYRIQSDSNLQALNQQIYPNEDLFQRPLEDYPDLLPGDQIDVASTLR